MFTGLIREIAFVKSFKNNILSLRAKYRPKIGDSIAINGACLSVVKLNSDGFEVELSNETQKKVALQRYANKVHIEPAMMLKDRIEGHLVQGHIDCVGEIIKIEKKANLNNFYIQIPKEFIKFVAPKGSIAVDGVSLTVNDVFEDSFRVSIITLTLKETLFSQYTIKTQVNIETDMFARYIYQFISAKKILVGMKLIRFYLCIN